jgi:hypothetical protein
MALSKEEKAQLDALTAKANDPGPDESFQVEYWEEAPDGTRRGGTVPWSQGKKMFGKWLPDLFGDKPEEDAEEATPDDGEPAKVQRFGRRVG